MSEGDHPKKVDFVVAGVQKGGTRALNVYLRNHPEICMAAAIEVHFFDKEEFFSNNPPDYSIYHSSFPQCELTKKWGDSTPIYVYWEHSPKRLFQYNRDMKIIISLRNPVTRAYSHWNMEFSRGAEPLPFSEAIQAEEERARDQFPLQDRVHSYVDRGFYVRQLERIWEFFPKKQTLIFKSEDLLNSPQEILNQITDFLEVERMPDIIPHHVHALPYREKMKKEDAELLLNRYRDEIKKLEALLGWDCSDWLNI